MEGEEDKEIVEEYDPKEEEEEGIVMVEYRVPMHCNACERLVAKTISKFQGVKQFSTQMHKHKVVVRGRIDPLILLEKLRKKTGKKGLVHIVEAAADGDKKNDDGGEGEATTVAGGNNTQDGGGGAGVVDGSGLEMVMAGVPFPYHYPYYYYCYYGSLPWRHDYYYYCHDALFTAFSDENPNACSLM